MKTKEKQYNDNIVYRYIRKLCIRVRYIDNNNNNSNMKQQKKYVGMWNSNNNDDKEKKNTKMDEVSKLIRKKKWSILKFFLICKTTLTLWYSEIKMKQKQTQYIYLFIVT